MDKRGYKGTELEMKTDKPLKFSPSAINLMLECPRCFWLEKHKVWKRPSSVFPSLPGGMDKVLKIHFDKFMEKGELPPEIREYEIGNCYKLLINQNWKSGEIIERESNTRIKPLGFY